MQTGATGQLLLGETGPEAECPATIADQAAPPTGAPQTLFQETSSHVPVDPANIPDEVAVKRTDPVYNAHAYLTKVPVTAIEPFVEAFTRPGDVVLDFYGGSGMTGIAAGMLGRRGEVRDISTLGRHIGSNYVNLVDPEAFRAAAAQVIAATVARLGDVYATRCEGCGEPGVLSRTVWSYLYECSVCHEPVNYYESFAATEDWKKTEMKCPHCQSPFTTRGSERIGEEPVLDTVSCPCSKRLRDQPHAEPLNPVALAGLSYPDVPIGEDRQMFHASALKKHGLLTTASFFSARNLAVLAALRERIRQVEEEALRDKLLFAFTAVLARASKRYQWHPKRPLNAANQTYYIAPVFYEWNVYDLFRRKARAVLRADDYIRERMRRHEVTEFGGVNYETGSADAVNLPDASVDYVFTDPPFGSNIFYSDMNLFQEAWLGDLTEYEDEAVVDRFRTGKTYRTAERYEELITKSLREAHRVLKPDGWLSLVFSSSSGKMWALVQRGLLAAGFVLEDVAILDKGQRSVKGLASGFENVVTVDLVLSARKAAPGHEGEVGDAPDGALATAVDDVLAGDAAPTPSHVYIGVIRDYLDRGWNVSALDIGGIGVVLGHLGYEVDPHSGRLQKKAKAADAT